MIRTDLVPRWHQVSTKSALSQEELKLLKLCREAKPVGELMRELDWKDRTKFRNRFIIPLIAKGLLTMTVPDKPKSRLQKYKVTQSGERLFAKKV